jgi:hypothetical protein
MGEAGKGWECERKTWEGDKVVFVILLRVLLVRSEVGTEVEEGKKLGS